MDCLVVFLVGVAFGAAVSHFARARRWYERGRLVERRRALTADARETTREPSFFEVGR